MAPDLKNDFELIKCKELFIELSRGLGRNDTVAIRDLFSYEIIPVLNKWSEHLDEEINLMNLS